MHIIVYIILPGKNTVKDGPVEKGRHKLVGFPSFSRIFTRMFGAFCGIGQDFSRNFPLFNLV